MSVRVRPIATAASVAAARRATAVTAVCGHVRRIGGGNDTEAAVVAVAANGTARRREMAQRGSGEAEGGERRLEVAVTAAVAATAAGRRWLTMIDVGTHCLCLLKRAFGGLYFVHRYWWP